VGGPPGDEFLQIWSIAGNEKRYCDSVKDNAETQKRPGEMKSRDFEAVDT
jgi:hypothetical protein